MRLTNLSDDELYDISLRRNKKGLYTPEALRAQELLCDRSGSNWGKARYQEYTKDSWNGSFDNAIRILEG